MTDSWGEVKSTVNPGLWYIGWHAKQSVVGVTLVAAAIGYYLDQPYLFGFSGLMFVAPIVWLTGMRHVNGNYKTVPNGLQGRLTTLSRTT
ncbi:hypothetical protein VB779_09435 [Haloarculaceae archaeon H-GB11]|nr:hypothetical protein [Haloarculaceae archaeon H-GB11]